MGMYQWCGNQSPPLKPAGGEGRLCQRGGLRVEQGGQVPGDFFGRKPTARDFSTIIE